MAKLIKEKKGGGKTVQCYETKRNISTDLADITNNLRGLYTQISRRM